MMETTKEKQKKIQESKEAKKVKKDKKNIKEIIEDVKKDKSIGLTTVVLVTVYLELFWAFKDLLKDLLKIIPYVNDVLAILIIFAIGLFSASTGYYLIYHFVRAFHLKKWKKKNMAMCVEGEWVHIHKKDITRIGYLHIDQDFDKLHVYGYNTNPNAKEKHAPITTWKYEVGRVIKNITHSSHDAEFEYYGSYCAERKMPLDDVRKVKYGVHRLEIMPSVDGLPKRMEGYFGDTAKNVEKEGAIEQHYGNLCFLKMSKDFCEKLASFKLPELKLQFIKEEFNKKGESDYSEINELYKISEDYENSKKAN